MLEIIRQRDVYFFSSSYHEAYVPFCEDDGPVNLSCVAQVPPPPHSHSLPPPSLSSPPSLFSADVPVNLWCVWQFCWFLRSKVTDPRLAGRHLAYYSTGDQALRSNAIFLLGTLGA